MALIVEDGSGLANAEAYISLAELRAYAAAQGLTAPTLVDDGPSEIALRRAAQWIDTRYRYKGARLTAGQALEFPRSGLLDWSSYPVEGIPSRVKAASAELAIRALNGATLAPDSAREAFVTKEQVGPISVTYADNAPQSTIFTGVESLLEPYKRAGGDTPVPFFGGATTGAFELGMMANPPSRPLESSDG